MEFCKINVDRLKRKLANFHVKNDQPDTQTFELEIGGKLWSVTFKYIDVEWDSVAIEIDEE
jgi:Na+-transporting NADH:ubiquinone oxidoreductase subunit NqrC